jgi:hypothetical protein
VEPLERCVDLGRVAAACLRKVRPPSSAAADHLRDFADQISGLVRADEILRHANCEQHLAAVLACDQHDTAPEPAAQIVDHRAHPLGVSSVDADPEALDAADLARLLEQVPRGRATLRLLRREQLALQALPLLQQLLDARRELTRRGLVRSL